MEKFKKPKTETNIGLKPKRKIDDIQRFENAMKTIRNIIDKHNGDPINQHESLWKNFTTHILNNRSLDEAKELSMVMECFVEEVGFELGCLNHGIEKPTYRSIDVAKNN